MQEQDGYNLEFLGLRVKFENDKTELDFFTKPTKSFMYVLPSSCYPRKNLNNILYGIALRLKHIYQNDGKFLFTDEYKNYLIARHYEPS